MAKQGQIFGTATRDRTPTLRTGCFSHTPATVRRSAGSPIRESTAMTMFRTPMVLEWLKDRSDFDGENRRIRRVGCDLQRVQPRALEAHHKLGMGLLHRGSRNPHADLVNRLKMETPRYWDDEPFDALTFYTAAEYLKARKPRVLYISFGETDDWAQEGKYKEYLDSAHRVNAYLKVFWDLAESMPKYRGTTTLIFSPDHGRGKSSKGRRDHGQKLPESRYIWMAFLGPDTPARGERSHIPPVTQSQIAATLAAFLGEDYAHDVPKAGTAIRDVLPAEAATDLRPAPPPTVR
jgi:hypothetical protein